jgi:hypothetical protein
LDLIPLGIHGADNVKRRGGILGIHDGLGCFLVRALQLGWQVL